MDWALFRRAVEDSDEPTPGYMYREMAQWTLRDFRLQRKLVDALFAELSKTSSPRVLCKVLRVIRSVCEIGHEGFQQEVQKADRVAVVKSFVGYGVAPGDVDGSQLRNKVRQEARETMNVIFEDHGESRLAAARSYGSGFGGGGEPINATSVWNSGGAKQPVESNTAMAGVLLSNVADKVALGFGVLPQQGEGLRGTRTKEQLYEDIIRATSSDCGEGLVCGVDVKVPHDHNPSASRVAPPPSLCKSDRSKNSAWDFICGYPQNGDDASKGMRSSNSTARLLQSATPFHLCVQHLCAREDTPQRMELHRFVAQCLQIGGNMIQQGKGDKGTVPDENAMGSCWDLLAEALSGQMNQTHPWKQRLNALIALEALLISRDEGFVSLSMRTYVKRYFCEKSEFVQQNLSVVQLTLRDQARRVAELVGFPIVSQVISSPCCMSTVPESSVAELRAEVSGENTASSAKDSPPVSNPTWEPRAATVGVGVGTSNDTGLGNMTLGVSRRRAYERRTLIRRAPVRQACEGRSERKDDIGGGSHTSDIGKMCKGNTQIFGAETLGSSGGSHEKVGDHSDCVSGFRENLLDELFGETMKSSTLSSVIGTGGTSSDDACFHTGGANMNDFDPFAEADVSYGESEFRTSTTGRPLELAPWCPSAGTSTGKGASYKNDSKTSTLHRSTSDTLTEVSPCVTAGPNSPLSEIARIQRQLQLLTSDLRESTNPALIAQLQKLHTQQEQMIQLIVRTQQLQLAERGGSNSIDTCPTVADGHHPAAASIYTHSRFMMGEVPASASVVRECFVKMQADMKASITASK